MFRMVVRNAASSPSEASPSQLKSHYSLWLFFFFVDEKKVPCVDVLFGRLAAASTNATFLASSGAHELSLIAWAFGRLQTRHLPLMEAIANRSSRGSRETMGRLGGHNSNG
jgi:hypothetical protein